LTTLGPKDGIEVLPVMIPISNGTYDGIQSTTYRKKGGAKALTLVFEDILKDPVGYSITELFKLRMDIVALPLTSFRPKSRNTTSREAIKVYVCVTNVSENGTSMKDLKRPGSTSIFVRNTLWYVIAKTPLDTVPIS